MQIELLASKSALDLERRAKGSEIVLGRSEPGSLSFSTSGKKSLSHGPQPRQVGGKQKQRGNSIK